MKALSILSAIVAASALLLSVQAGPVPQYFDGKPTTSLERRNTNSAERAAAWIKDPANHAKLTAKPICWCSGTTKIGGNEHSVYSYMETFAQTHGCNDIDDIMSIAGKSLDSNGWVTEHWMIVSKALAEHTSGTTYVILGETVQPKSIWLTAELPALMANHAVTTIKAFVLNRHNQIVPHGNLKG